MSRLPPIQADGAALELKRSLKNSRWKLKDVPNFFRLLANSPASLRAYLRPDPALVRGQLTPRQHHQVALPVPEANGSSFHLSAHHYTGKSHGLPLQPHQLPP